MFRRSTSSHAVVRPLLAALCAGALAVTLAPFAAAEGNVVFRNHITDKVSHIEQEEHGPDFCPDVPFLVRFDASFTVTETGIRKGGGDLEYFRFHIAQRATYTNVETGASFHEISKFTGSDQKLTLNDDGTLTVTFMDRFSNKLFDDNGKLVAIDTGIFSATLVIDLNDPNDPEDDEVISETIIKDHGLRGFEGRDFCQDVMTFLG